MVNFGVPWYLNRPCNFKGTFLKTDAIKLVDVANNFVGEKANRKQLFGKLSTNDVPKKVSFLTKSTQTVALLTELVSMWVCILKGAGEGFG